MAKILPITNIVIAVGACLVYAYFGNLRKVIYWGAAAALTWSVTF